MFSVHRGAVLAAGLGVVVPIAVGAGAIAQASLRASTPGPIGDGRAQAARPSTGVVVAGTLATRDGRRLLSGSIGLHSLDGGASSNLPVASADILQDGSFTFRNVPPGHYQLRARAHVQGARRPHFSLFQVAVGEHDLVRLELMLLPAATVSGKVIVDAVSSDSPRLAGARVLSVSFDGDTVLDRAVASVGDDGAFRLQGLVAGTHALAVEGLPAVWVIKSVMHRGRDLTDTGFEATSGQELTDVRVTVTDAASEVTGTVRDAAGLPAPGATVLALPVGEHYWTRTSRRLGRTRSEQDGRYRFRGLPAGEYRLVALVALPESQLYNRERLRELVAAGFPLRLLPLETRALDVVLTTGPSSR